MDKMEMRRREFNRENIREKSTDGIGFKVLSTLLFMYVLTGLLLFAMAFLLYKFKLDETFVMVGIIVVYIVSGFLGGCMMRIRLKSSCAFLGLLLGTLYFFVLFIGSAILNHGMPSEILRLIAVWIMCGCGGMLGGMLGRRG